MYKSVHEGKKCLVNYHKEKKIVHEGKKSLLHFALNFGIYQKKIINIILLNAF